MLCQSNIHELGEGSDNTFCPECAICSLCHEQISLEEYQHALSSARKYDSIPSFSHFHCISEKQTQAVKVQQDTKTIAYVVDKANAARLTIWPIVGSGKDNADHWYNETIKQNHDKSFAEISLLLKALEGAAAACQLLANSIRKKQNILSVEDLEDQRKSHVKAKDKAALEAAEKRREIDADKRLVSQLTPEEADVYKKNQKQVDVLIKLGLSKPDANCTS